MIKKLKFKKKVKIGAVVVVAGGLYVLHRRKLDSVITMMLEQSQAAVQDSMWTSWDEGVKYGLDLAMSNNEIAKDLKEVTKKYAFDAFDKAS